jgi:hypothetical protein
MNPNEILEKLEAQVKESNGNPPIVNGVFGDVENCNGVLELPVIYPPEGGTKFKVFGCTYEFKGLPEVHVVEGLGLAKAMISALPREFIIKNFANSLSLAWNIVFRRKKFIHMVRVYFATIYANEVAKIGIASDKYSDLVREIKRSIKAVNDRIMAKRGWDETKFSNLNTDFQVINDKEFLELAALFTEFICVFIELDSAYRFRAQDVFENLNKENVKKNVVKEVRRLLDIAISREDPEHGILYKLVPTAKLIVLLLRLSKELRDYVRAFFLELDLEKVRLDEADWYFCLQRRAYNFRGISLGERLLEKKRIDEEKGHVFLGFVTNYNIACPTCKAELTFPQSQVSSLEKSSQILVPGCTPKS